ncbi:MAG: CerR family C-terminal domain-containing protein [Lentisphaerota bacterium]
MIDTKKKILTAAAKEFAAKGYNGATIRDICKQAEVNVASINYHFKSKESLYHEMFEFLFCETEGGNVFDKEYDGDFLEWKAIIYIWIEKIIFDIIHENPLNQYKWKIFSREMQDPSEIFPNIYKTFMKPRLSTLASHFRKVLPQKTSDDDIYIRVFSVISYCIFYFNDRVLINMTFPNRKFISENMEKIINHITDIACIGMNCEKQETI